MRLPTGGDSNFQSSQSPVQTVTVKPPGTLVSFTLKVIGGWVFVPIGCQSGVPCNGRFSITAKAKHRKKRAASVLLCDTTSYTVKAGKTKNVKATISGACLARLNHVKSHRTNAQFSLGPPNGPLGAITNIMLTL